MPTFARKALACVALLAFSQNGARLIAQTAEAKRDPRIDQVLDNLGKVRAIYQTAISPDGKLLAWVVAGEEAGKRGGTEIELAPLAAPGKTTRITAATKGELCNESSLAWSPDSKTLAFLSDCQAGTDHPGQSDFYLADVSPPEAKPAPRRLTRLHGIPESPAFSPNGKQLAFLYVEGATRRASPLAAEKPTAGVIGEDGLEIKRVAAVTIPQMEEHAPLPPGAVAIHNLPLDAKHLAQSNQTPTLITPASLYTYEFDWSPDSEQLAYIAAPPPGENNWWVAQLYSQPITSEKPTPILDPTNTPGPLHGLQIAVPRWSPEGKQIAFIGGLMSDQGSTGGDIYVVNSSGGAAKNLTPGRTTTPVWLRWDSVSTLRFTEIVSGSSQLSRLDLISGRADEPDFVLPESMGDGSLDMSLSFSQVGKVAMIRSSFSSAPEVWTWNPTADASGRHFTRVTQINSELRPAWGNAENNQWTSDKFHVDSWLLYPANYDPAKKYPLIVYVHGGPSSATLPHWPRAGFGPAPFAALGYFVLMPNPRGSYGQGEAFTQANRKDFGYGDLRDILAGVDAVTKSHNIDPQRVGLTGWSYGGFMTMFAVTQTNRFRAAVAGAGISDWQSYYGQNSIDQWMIPFMGASVYDDPSVYAKVSAVNFIKNVKTPTLSVVGDRDGECPAPQSFEFWHALKAQHVPTQLVVYPNEGHGFVNPEHQRDVIARALDWFQKYMPAN